VRFAEIVELLEAGDPETIRAAAFVLHAVHQALPDVARDWTAYSTGSIGDKPAAQLNREDAQLDHSTGRLRTLLLCAARDLRREGNTRIPEGRP
jgi:hypothetical protein